jgi:hypothetical protein
VIGHPPVRLGKVKSGIYRVIERVAYEGLGDPSALVFGPNRQRAEM